MGRRARRVGRVVDEQHVVGRRLKLAHRAHAAVHAPGRWSPACSRAAPPPLGEQPPVGERLAGHGVDGAGAAEELMDDHAGGSRRSCSAIQVSRPRTRSSSALA